MKDLFAQTGWATILLAAVPTALITICVVVVALAARRPATRRHCLAVITHLTRVRQRPAELSMISTDSASATIAQDRRLSALGTLEQALDGRDARPLHEVVADNLREVWKNGGKKRDDKPGLKPSAFWIRDGFVATAAEDAHGPALPRLIQSKGLQLRLYLLMLFEAQCRHEAG